MYHGERLNSYTHLLGGLATCAGVTALLTAAIRTGNATLLLSCAIYGASTLGMFFASAAYHSVRGDRKVFLRKIDHIAIFVMTAGTYTPFCLGPLRDGEGLPILAAAWALAALGTVLEFALAHKTRAASFVIYFAMAFGSISTFPGLERALGATPVHLIKVGFALYAVGFAFYVLDKKFRGRHLHGIWHLFVIAAACVHYACIYEYVL
jgi:hemolysin III